MGLRDSLEEILVEEAKKAGPDAHGPNLMRKMARDEVSMDRYVKWLESQPVEMLQKTYWIMIAGWNERREGLANVTTLFRDAIGYVSSNGSRPAATATVPALPTSSKDEALVDGIVARAKKKKDCCPQPAIVKTETGKYCKTCGKRWKRKKKHA